jgi:hypothetical protein
MHVCYLCIYVCYLCIYVCYLCTFTKAIYACMPMLSVDFVYQCVWEAKTELVSWFANLAKSAWPRYTFPNGGPQNMRDILVIGSAEDGCRGWGHWKKANYFLMAGISGTARTAQPTASSVFFSFVVLIQSNCWSAGLGSSGLYFISWKIRKCSISLHF